jgi:hypothetical protein
MLPGMDGEPLIQREELVPILFAVHDLVREVRTISASWKPRTVGKKRKKIWASEAEREAWDAHVDETLRRLWEVATKAQAELDAKQAARERAEGADA